MGIASNQCHWDTAPGHAGGGVGAHGGQDAAAKVWRSVQFCVSVFPKSQDRAGCAFRQASWYSADPVSSRLAPAGSKLAQE